MDKNNNQQSYVQQLKSGAIAVIPTDTVYGIVCRAADESAVKRLYAMKKCEKKPGTIIAASIDQLVELGLKARYLKAVQDYWPNPITIIIPTGFDLQHLSQGTGSLAVRVTSDPALRELLAQTGPLLTSSANQPGEPPANTVEEARTYFGDEVDLYVNGGDLSDRQPSTIIRVIDDAVEVLRQGAIMINEETGSITE